MTHMLLKTLPLVAIAGLSACGGSSSDRAALAFKQVDCAKQAGIGNTFSTQVVVRDGKHTEVFIPGNGVSEAQAAKANACMAV